MRRAIEGQTRPFGALAPENAQPPGNEVAPGAAGIRGTSNSSRDVAVGPRGRSRPSYAPDNTNPTSAYGAAWGRWRIGATRAPPREPRQAIGANSHPAGNPARRTRAKENEAALVRPTVAGQRRHWTGF